MRSPGTLRTKWEVPESTRAGSEGHIVGNDPQGVRSPSTAIVQHSSVVAILPSVRLHVRAQRKAVHGLPRFGEVVISLRHSGLIRYRLSEAKLSNAGSPR